MYTGTMELEAVQFAVGSSVTHHATAEQGVITRVLGDDSVFCQFPGEPGESGPFKLDGDVCQPLVLAPKRSALIQNVHSARYGQKVLLGLVLWLDEDAAVLEFPEFRARVRARVRRSTGPAAEICVEEEEFLAGRECEGWHVRFRGERWRPGTTYTLVRGQDGALGGTVRFDGGELAAGAVIRGLCALRDAALTGGSRGGQAR
jgi:hypothetical protein